MLGSKMERQVYEYSHYLLFGDVAGDVYNNVLDCSWTKEYLENMGFANSSLTQARKKSAESRVYNVFRVAGERYCDFCYRPLSGVEFDRLKDGRERCIECSKTVVHGQESFEALFHQVREGLCEKYEIDLPTAMSVQVVTQAKLSKMLGKKFIPTKYPDPRAVGFATKRKGSYGVVFENGTPRLTLLATTAHELTHVWQYTHWNEQAIKSKYGRLELAVYEGMAKWSEIQYLFLMNETTRAKDTLQSEVERTDVYGFGLRLFLNQYPLSRGIHLEGDTPFNHVNNPIDLDMALAQELAK